MMNTSLSPIIRRFRPTSKSNVGIMAFPLFTLERLHIPANWVFLQLAETARNLAARRPQAAQAPLQYAFELQVEPHSFVAFREQP